MKKQRMTKRIWVTCLCLAVLSPMTLSAQEVKSDEKDYTRGWYIGTQAGIPMAEAEFSSFGADKFRPGWSAGLYAGYRFTPVWSLEMTAGWGQQFLDVQQCCYERDYFLGSDHNRYRDGFHFPEGVQGWLYKDLKSRTFVQRYGLQVNMNILGFFNRTKESRWRLELSPAVYAVGTSSDLMTKAENTPVADNLNDWHLGYGGQAQVSYAVADNMNIGLYGGFTHLTGKPMDGMPELHSTNFIIDAGVKFSFAFGKVKGERSKVKRGNEVKGEKSKVKTEDDLNAIPSATTAVLNDTPVIQSDSEESRDSSLQSSTSVQNDIVEEVSTSDLSPLTFPVIYFSFNSVWIEPNEKAKIKEIADMMKARPDMRVRITGWGDNVGGEEVNKRVSLQRAEAVKRMLGKWLIPAERVETVGAGIAHDAQSREEARHAATVEVKGENYE